jgi:hypothetical protein
MSTAYYIASQSGNVVGPYEEKEIVDLVTDGLLNVEDKCTREGLEDWKPLGNVVPAVWSSPGAKARVRRCKRVSYHESFGIGLAVQILGLVMFFLLSPWPVGIAVGLFLIAVGSRISRATKCGGCGYRLEDSKAHRCPGCSSELV